MTTDFFQQFFLNRRFQQVNLSQDDTFPILAKTLEQLQQEKNGGQKKTIEIAQQFFNQILQLIESKMMIHGLTTQVRSQGENNSGFWQNPDNNHPEEKKGIQPGSHN